MGALSLEAPASRTAEARENVELADAGSAHEPGHATASRIWLRPSIAVGGWFALVLATNVWGQVLLGQGRHLFLGTPPLYGWLRSVQPGRIALPLLGAIAVAACAARWGVALSARLGWRALLCWTAVAAAVWAVALALVDPLGPAALVRPLRLPTESYQLPLPPSVLDFLAKPFQPADLRALVQRALPAH